MNNLVDLTQLTSRLDLSAGRLDILDANDDVVLKLTLVSKEFSDHFDIIDQNEDTMVEVGFFSIYLPIASSWSAPNHGRVREITDDTPQEVVDVANHFLAGGVNGIPLRDDLNGLALYVSANVDVELESMVAPASFEHPAEYVSHCVSLEVDPKDLVSTQVSEDPEKFLDFVGSYYKVEDYEGLLERASLFVITE